MIGLFNRYKNKFINSAIFIIAVVIAFNIHAGQNKQIAALEEKKSQELKKNEILNEIAALEKKVSTYKKQVNTKEISGVINRIGIIAKESSVVLESINPQEKKDFDIYTNYNFQIKISSDNYHNIGEFVSRLENHPDIYFVGSISISLLEIQGADNEKNRQKLEADLEVSTILVKT